MIILLWIRGVLARRFLRVAGAAAGIALTVALLATMALFLASAGASMTVRAVLAVPIDWQVQVISGVDPDLVGKALTDAAPVTAVHPVRYADVAGFEAQTGGTTQTTGPGQAAAFDSQYSSDFPAEIRSLSGTLDGALIAQQTAANLHVGPGDTVSVRRIGLPPAEVRIAGVVDLPDADALFQAVGLPPQAAPQAPPDNVLILPQEAWRQLFDPQQKARPDTTRLQLHVRLAHKALPPDPVTAYTFVTAAQHNLEARVAGQALVADNLGSRLGAVREDALYASVLFLFLGLPGVALAVALTFAVTASSAARRRTEQALLRVRGATTKAILLLSATEAAVAAIAGTAIGMAAASLLAIIVPGLGAVLGVNVPTLLLVALFGLLVGFIAFLYPAWRDARWATVTAARRTVSRPGAPLWQRLWLDMLLLAAAGLFFWQSASTGYQIVLAPEGVAATAVDYKAFVAPALFWLGTALLTIRLSATVIARNGALLRMIVAPASGALAPIVSAALSRQAGRLTIGIAMTALAISFATSTAIFNTTYNAQARIDAELTNGSDVTVFGTTDRPAGAHLAALASLPEAATAEPMQHRFAYVGADLQDLYGIDPARIGRATGLSDAYFSGASAAGTLALLAATPDGVLVSEETVQDFQLQQGDTINLRLIDARDHQYHPVAFKFIGVAREFPTAPKDSFLVANSAYVAGMTGSDASEYVLMRARADPAALARQVSSALTSDPSLKVADIGQAAHLIGSSLTAVDLAGLTTIELGFAVVMAAAAAGLMLALGFFERRRPFAILAAIGAKPRQLAAFLWSEGLLVLVGGMTFGLLSGLLTAWMLVKLLTGVFDPPPEALSIPWLYLAVMLGLVAASVAAAVWSAKPSAEQAAEQLRDL
ncbi:ABC transporter permease [Mesorhizobium japonicum]|uniref:ABC transporter integral membrane protein n=1 Tax=Mesorhizobium japonicum (strain LMG 29417 / CECT 9101 / MAFF 303099) TaxID=266835 RepID=Q98E04_RHILO|nr:ABC transporter permease [Mesorhizobium japonicum]BAB51116.1 ABC transporter integral membrane protein [Mesorhizobium japonicum MAFF 303099]